eukprot:14601983-Ditylum_brightwellii.AAC.1
MDQACQQFRRSKLVTTRQQQLLAPSIPSKHSTTNLLKVNEGDKTSEEGFNRDSDGHYGNAGIMATSMIVTTTSMTAMATDMTVTVTATVMGMTAHISRLLL